VPFFGSQVDIDSRVENLITGLVFGLNFLEGIGRVVEHAQLTDLPHFDYAEIRQFGSRALDALSQALPGAKRVMLTLHGPGYGLDESESFRAELAGLLDALKSGHHPPSLEEIIIIDRGARRADRLTRLLTSILPAGKVGARQAQMEAVAPSARASLAEAGEGSKNKPHIFVAMPFAKEFDDRFHYGIQRAAEAAGFLSERTDLATFVGDVFDWVRERIDSAAFVVADLTTANPNVYLEVGYAWGVRVPTVLLVKEADELKFDVKGQRCLVYSGSIRQLEHLLTRELSSLRHHV
jgi:hypothetical protein